MIVLGPSNCGEFTCCLKGGRRSPQVAPLSVDQSMPHWLKPTRLSFCPTTKLVGSAGLKAISVSACRRNVQSWFARTFVDPLFRAPQPSDEVGGDPKIRSASLAGS